MILFVLESMESLLSYRIGFSATTNFDRYIKKYQEINMSRYLYLIEIPRNTKTVQSGEECTRDFLYGIGEEKQRFACQCCFSFHIFIDALNLACTTMT